jgi:hypothetical protein
MGPRPRVIVSSPHAAECAVVSDWLASEGFEPVRVSNVERVAEEIRDRAFDAFVVDHGIAFKQAPQTIGSVRARNPRTPIIVIGEPDAACEAQVLTRGAMYLPRPVDRMSLVCTVSMAVMESRPERRSPRKRVNRFEAVVEGIPAHIVDVSREGLRLEVPRGRKSSPPPPIFNVTVPMLGITLSVRRMWTCSLPDAAKNAVWYGGELANNARRIELAWLRLVDTIPSAGTALELQ